MTKGWFIASTVYYRLEGRGRKQQQQQHWTNVVVWEFKPFSSSFQLSARGIHTTCFANDTWKILKSRLKLSKRDVQLFDESYWALCFWSWYSTSVLFILSDLNTDLYLVQDGTVAPILKTPILSSMIPPIEPYIKDLKFRFNATGAVGMLIKSDI